jgi:acyl-CoA synthetase (AMP-forming)/AMP-acid ligase II
MPAEPSVDARPAVAFSCLHGLLEYHARHRPNACAILAPGRAPLSYAGLYRQVDTIEHTLRAIGISRHDRMALVLPNGPDAAVAILAVAASAVCVPMNPAYRAKELDRYFADLRPNALIEKPGIDSPARRVALSRGIRVVDLSVVPDAQAGHFTFAGDYGAAPPLQPANPDDLALLLLTSGTTSRPKIVRLTHGNICAAARDWGEALALKESDRCLNVVPLFHGHGLIASVLASLAAGSSVVCTPGCDLDSFFAWLTEFWPTWYSAVPAMHQAILARARQYPGQVANPRLRFIRSASAPLSPSVSTQLEQTFAAPVIEIYGMTETASSPIASNPLPPRQRKTGSVGIPVGLDVAIMDKNEAFLPGGLTGQVAVRGASITSGYDGHPVADHAAFAGDWLKTGDLGFFDDEGYLFLTGRSKEIINRGGEKIAPREIDEVLLEHPAVAEAVTFAIPHPTLGEDVAAAIVLRTDAAATPQDIRRFVIGRVAGFKVPRRVFIVGEIPKGPTGKVQRVGLASRLGIVDRIAIRRTSVAPRTLLEKRLAEYCAEILRVERVGIHDDFFALGGDSLLATQVLAYIHEITHLEVEIARFFEAPTVANMAHYLQTLIRAGRGGRSFSAIARFPRENQAPASIAQGRLWNLQRALPAMPFFNALHTLRLTSSFDTAVLAQSVNEIVQRHEILRTTFAEVDGQCVQVIAQRLAIELSFDDLHGLPEAERETLGHQLVQEEVLHCFDLARGPLFRARLVRLTKQEHLLLFTLHQIIADGWSMGVLVSELADVYEAFSARKVSPLAPPSLQYADFANWQRHWRSQPDIVAQLEYWRDQLRDPLPAINLTVPRPRQTIDGLLAARRPLAIPASLSEAAKRFSHRAGGTLFMALVAALKTLLHRYVGQDDVRVATLVANRNRPGAAGLIGPLVNTVVLRTYLGGDPSPQDVMRRVRATILAAFAHQDLPFEALVETLERERALKPAALSQVMIMLHNASLRPTRSSGHRLTFEEANPGMLMPLVTATTFDVTLTLHECAEGLVGSCVYNPHFFGVKMIDRLIQDYQEVLEQMVARPRQPISAIHVSSNEGPSIS